MFGIGGFELFIILIFGFLIFGPDKLPEIAKTVGRGIARFREAQQEMNEVIGDEKLIDLDNPDEPFKDPVEALDRIAKRQEEKRAGKSAAGGASAGSSAAAADSAGAASISSVDEGEASSDDKPKQESFTERKARYERERAARKAAEAEAAKTKDSVVDGDNGNHSTGARSARPADSPESATDDPATPTDVSATDNTATPREGGDA